MHLEKLAKFSSVLTHYGRAQLNFMTNTLIPISGMMPQELQEKLHFSQSFRSKQIFKWIAEGVKNFDEMTNIPLSDRKILSERFTVFSTSIEQTLKDPDGTIKLQIKTHEGYAIETVLLIDSSNRKTACVSCQIGCPMGCAFCQTGHIGYKRNLEPNEIIEQFLYLEEVVGKLDNIVFMGMGEPLLNLDAIKKTVDILTHPQGRSLSKRRITLSTSGLCDGIRQLADYGLGLRLAVSLTTANENLRNSLMPVNKNCDLSKLKESIAYFIQKTGTRVTLEAVLMAGVNTSEENAKEMAIFCRDLNVHVNLISWNPVPNLPFNTPSRSEVHRFIEYLDKLGVKVTLRMKRGRTIGGACGQLGRSSI